MFEPLNDLERLLMAAATDPAQRPAFSKAVLEAELFVSPLSEPDAVGRVSGLRSVTVGEGAIACAVFTAPERGLAAFGPDILFIGNNGRALLDWLRPGPIFLNPGQDYGVVWQPEDLELLLDGMTKEVIQKETKIMLGLPVQRPEELLRRLTHSLSSDPDVREAYLMQAYRPERDQYSWMLGVKTRGDWRSVQALIRQAVDGLSLEWPLDAVQLDGSEFAATLSTGFVIVAPQTDPSSAPPKIRLPFKPFGKD